ncbi:MAG: dienelactone hydrolase family protein [Bacteroidota bacterium]
MFKKTIFLSIALCLLALCISCGEASTSKTEGEGMNKFANDKEFKEAHEEPTKLEYEEKGQWISFATEDGQEGKAYALKTEAASDKYLFVIHEWWGLNDNVKREAERYFEELSGTNVLALDLYDGNVADNREDASKYMQAVKEERANAIIKGALAHAGENAKVATVGWCFGGGWSLRSSILAENQGVGCVIYYGAPVEKADQLVPLKADVLGIFAEKDGWITPKVVSDFEALAKATGKSVKVHQFDADHAFANPSSPRYNEAAATAANQLTLAFLQDHLK